MDISNGLNFLFVTHGSFDRHATLKRATGMANPLLEKGHRVSIILQNSEINCEKVSMECPDARIFWLHENKSFWTEARDKQSIIDKLRPNLIWICGVGPRNWVKGTSKGTIVLADHSELYSMFSKDIGRRIFYRMIEIMSCYRHDGHICASRFLENYYRNRLSKAKISSPIHYLTYAYHSGILNYKATNAGNRQEALDAKKTFLYIGGLQKSYGFWDMLEGGKRLHAKRKDFQMLIFGRGPEEIPGRSWVSRNGLCEAIKISGYLPEDKIVSNLKLADAFLCPMRDTTQDWARCPSKLFMYVPFERPIITCRIGEALELLGEGGSYYEPGNPDSLCTVMCKVLDGEKPLVKIDASQHNYEARTKSFLDWMNR